MHQRAGVEQAKGIELRTVDEQDVVPVDKRQEEHAESGKYKDERRDARVAEGYGGG
jgi:hypothetical protein